MIVPLMAISNFVLTQQIYSEETNGAHAHYREPVPLNYGQYSLITWWLITQGPDQMGPSVGWISFFWP